MRRASGGAALHTSRNLATLASFIAQKHGGCREPPFHSPRSAEQREATPCALGIAQK
jgi:hypothetical protein